MGLFDFLKSNRTKTFITESQSIQNKQNQIKMVSETLSQLRQLKVDENQKLKAEFFFYTNQLEKAEYLAAELSNLDYLVEFCQSQEDSKLFMVTGWTAPIQMSGNVISEWVEKMCDLGLKYDSEFDGWGTTPEQ